MNANCFTKIEVLSQITMWTYFDLNFDALYLLSVEMDPLNHFLYSYYGGRMVMFLILQTFWPCFSFHYKCMFLFHFYFNVWYILLSFAFSNWGHEGTLHPSPLRVNTVLGVTCFSRLVSILFRFSLLAFVFPNLSD